MNNSKPSAFTSTRELLQDLSLQKKLPQALLLLAPTYLNTSTFVQQLIQNYLCKSNSKKSCGICQSCVLLAQNSHPDVLYVGEEDGIKVDHIRDLQLDIYHTPKLSDYRFLILKSADKLNVYAANALLKILEEPPQHTLFILMAEQTYGMLPTLLSRCQRYAFLDSEGSYWALMKEEGEVSTPRGQLIQQASEMLEVLYDMIHKKTHPCQVASKWSTYSLEDVLWFLYVTTAQMLQVKWIVPPPEQTLPEKLIVLSKSLHPLNLFKQLDKINALLKNIKHRINMNSTLALEGVLLDYLRCAS